ncbi:MAG: alkaline phosphatase [Bryobacteraceae bacterium]
MRRIFLSLLLAACAFAQGRNQRAKNVILFLGDGTGPSTVNAASIQGYGEPRSLYIQNMPYIGLSETSSASSWVSDSAAGMTAIVTGQKTHNGVISQSSTAVRKEKDGEPLKTILEYAEERGLATGLVSNSAMADATPAACYAHVNERAKFGEIFAQVLKPRFGDGVDVIIGPGRARIIKETALMGLDLSAELPKSKYAFFDSVDALAGLDAKASRVISLFDGEFDLSAAVDHAIRILSRNPKGFFLMVESNNHSKDVKQTLDRTVAMDKIIRRIAEAFRKDSLILFTADHSYDLRLPRGAKGTDILPLVKVDGSHSAEEVLVAATGPGSDKVRGIIPNTRIFHIMMEAYGWQPGK